ncbi:MAG: hypothetical protein PVJ57_08470 [Phycisphaerae bacterium]|jgi:hypothetical protein
MNSGSEQVAGDPVPAAGTVRVERGTCFALFAYDVGLAIDLDEAQRRITALAQRASICHKRRAPRYFEYQPPPLRVTQTVEPVRICGFETAATVDSVIYDFGAVSVTYTIPLTVPLADLAGLSDELYDNEALLAASRRGVAALLDTIGPAVRKPQVADLVEDYTIFEIDALSSPWTTEDVIARHGPLLARILRAESAALSRQEIDDALACQLSFSTSDCAVIDWNAAFLFDADADDVRAVLEFANVELLEMRYLDDRLDAALDQAYAAMTKRAGGRYRVLGSKAEDLWRIAELQMDSAELFEGVTNALKLLGDQYLARVYRLTAQRFHLSDWDASIRRKLSTMESIYEKISDRQANWRVEVLEWIIIILIAVEIVLMLCESLWKG